MCNHASWHDAIVHDVWTSLPRAHQLASCINGCINGNSNSNGKRLCVLCTNKYHILILLLGVWPIGLVVWWVSQALRPDYRGNPHMAGKVYMPMAYAHPQMMAQGMAQGMQMQGMQSMQGMQGMQSMAQMGLPMNVLGMAHMTGAHQQASATSPTVSSMSMSYASKNGMPPS